jgi:hypothetical protein
MHLPPDDIDLWISDLKDIRINTLKHTDFKVRNTATHLDRAIEILIDYTANRDRQQFIPEPPPIGCTINKQYYQCPSGYHWVNRRLKNGAPGFCRRNPQRKK